MNYLKLISIICINSSLIAGSCCFDFCKSSSSDCSSSSSDCCVSSSSSSSSSDCSSSESRAEQRVEEAYHLRKKQAQRQTIDQPVYNIFEDEDNGEDVTYKNQNFVGSFSKTLPHDINGILTTPVGVASYKQMVKAVLSEQQADYNAIVRAPGATVKLVDPQGSATFSITGADSWSLPILPAPTLSSAQAGADMMEDYAMELSRDINFNDYATNPFINDLATKLFSALPGYTGPTSAPLLFRADVPGALVGPYISQFLLLNLNPLNFPFNLLSEQQLVPVASTREFGTTLANFVAIENGTVPQPYIGSDFTTPGRYIITGRDLATIVHNEPPFAFYYNAANILLNLGFPFSAASPYLNGSITNESPFIVYGQPDVYTALGSVTTEALKHAWAHKWLVNRRLRPEAMAGLVNLAKFTGTNPYNLNSNIFAIYSGLDLLALVRLHNNLNSNPGDTYLLSQVYPEASPAHPSYPAGHAVIGGACVTVLKALFQDNVTIITKIPPQTPNSNGSAFVNVTDGSQLVMTVGSELDKLAANIGMGRDWAGIHYRSDCEQGMLLGEQVALRWLQDHAAIITEQGFTGFVVTKFDGTTVTVTAKGIF